MASQWTEELVQYRMLFDEWCAGQLNILEQSITHHNQSIADQTGTHRKNLDLHASSALPNAHTTHLRCCMQTAQLSATEERAKQAAELSAAIRQGWSCKSAV
jgi:hypothetical protein